MDKWCKLFYFLTTRFKKNKFCIDKSNQEETVWVRGVPVPHQNRIELTYGEKEYSWESGRNLKSITDGDNTYIPIYLLEVDILVYFVKQRFQKLNLKLNLIQKKD